MVISNMINQLSVGRALVVTDQFNTVGIRGSIKAGLLPLAGRGLSFSRSRILLKMMVSWGSLPASGERVQAENVLVDQAEPVETTRIRRALI